MYIYIYLFCYSTNSLKKDDPWRNISPLGKSNFVSHSSNTKKRRESSLYQAVSSTSKLKKKKKEHSHETYHRVCRNVT